ncbi:MAG TPA: hypothetical protein VFE54_04150 [Mucilaginibacter sp.]|nr:hypothetical protein [Mucilaginibacter sp.]
MKRHIIITILLLVATVLVTVVYFKHLSNTAQHTGLVMRTIPNDASLIFEFNNDKEFYDIFSSDKLFSNFLGDDKLDELIALRKNLLQNSLMAKYVSGQNLFISLHPQKGNSIDFLLTASVSKEFQSDILEQIAKQPKNGMLIHSIDIEGKPGYVIYLNDLKKRFYMINRDDHSLSASFSKDVIANCARYDYKKEKETFVLLSDRLQSNSLANLYVNYQALSPLFEQVFVNKNTDIFKNFRQFPAFAALSLNYKSDAIMFNGSSEIQGNQEGGYLGLFSHQRPVTNHLKEIFPSTTAYSVSFAVSDPAKFESDLGVLQSKSNFNKEERTILKKIKSETGIAIQKEFSRSLANEFAIVTTHYHEKIGIIQLKDGSRLLALLVNISKMNSDNTGQFNYEKLSQILLGDAFYLFKRPYFKVIDNYLVLTNTPSELVSYNDSYTNRKFLVNTECYNEFNNLLAEMCNVSFFIQFKNAAQLFKQDMKPSFYNDFNKSEPGWKNFYGASWQFSSSDKSFYTNFCMRLNSDTTTLKSTF